MKARSWIGTSGWTYSSWKGPFYPDDLSSRRYLEFYAREFPTTEVNYSFYHLPRPETYAKWTGQVPNNFLFAVKASRLMTHTKRLLDVEEAWRTVARFHQGCRGRRQARSPPGATSMGAAHGWLRSPFGELGVRIRCHRAFSRALVVMRS